MPRPQTPLTVATTLVAGVVAFAVVYGISGSVRGTEMDAAEGIIPGVLSAITLVAWDYYRLPERDRVAPAHAIGLGVLNLLALAWVVVMRTGLGEMRWHSWLAGAVALLPAAYLVLAAVRQLRAGGGEGG
ncbi:MAG: hypothetical protein AB7N73_05515 [Gemmatimonadales bacterium]